MTRICFSGPNKLRGSGASPSPIAKCSRASKSLYREKGRLSAGIIDEAEGLPSNATYIKHFGSLENAYRLIKYSPKYKFHPVDGSVVLNTHVAKFANEMISAIERAGGTASFDTVRRVLTVNGTLTISVYIARCLRVEPAGYAGRSGVASTSTANGSSRFERI